MVFARISNRGGYVAIFTATGCFIAAYALTRIGYIRPPSLLMIGGLYVGITVALYTRGGIAIPALQLYLIVVVIASVLLSRRWTYAVGGLTLVTAIFVWILQIQQRLPSTNFEPSLFANFGIFAASLFLIIFVVTFSTMHLFQAIEQTNRANEILVKSEKQQASLNKELQASVAALKASQQQLAETTQFLGLVTENVPAIITYLDGERIIRFANQYVSHFGYGVEDVLNRTLEEILLPEEYAQITSALTEAYEGMAVSGRFIIKVSDHNLRTIQYSVVPQTENGAVTGIFVVGIDVTQQKRIEEAYMRSQKLERLGILAGGIAHDFNNLLVAMLGQTSLLEHKLGMEHGAYKHARRARMAAEQAATLTKQMLAFSGKGHFELARLDLNQLVLDNLMLLETSIPKDVELVPELTENNAEIIADLGQIQQLVMNLIINGAQAIADGEGTIWIRTRQLYLSGNESEYWHYTSAELPAGRYLALEIEDTGGGMDADTTERIFDPFFTTKSAGSGLGLSAVLGIIRGHRAGITVESRPGEGTIFRLVFSQERSLDAADELAKEFERIGRGQFAAVLVIDDEAHVRNTADDILQAQHIKTFVAENGEVGLSLFAKHRDEVDLILLDLTMPGRDGDKIFAELRCIDPHIPIIVSSGYNRAESTKRIIQQGSAGFLQKPYRDDELIDAVWRLLR